MKSKEASPATLYGHLAAERWERCRAGWFLRIGKPALAMECQLRATDHSRAASETAANIKKH